MKPTLPEDREPDETGADVSEHYRAGTRDEPPARLDAAILAAARREVAQPRPRRNWHMPASIAAMLVIGVSLVLIVRDNEPPLVSLESPADEAKLAKAVPPKLAMKAQPKGRADFHREDRPSRDRTARPDREPVMRDEMTGMQANSAASATTGQTQPAPASAPAAPPIAAPGKASEQEQSRIAESSDLSAPQKEKLQADAANESRGGAQAMRKQETAVPVRQQQRLDEIDRLLRDGKGAEALQRLLDFRKQYPEYPLPERLQALLPPEAGK